MGKEKKAKKAKKEAKEEEQQVVESAPEDARKTKKKRESPNPEPAAAESLAASLFGGGNPAKTSLAELFSAVRIAQRWPGVTSALCVSAQDLSIPHQRQGCPHRPAIVHCITPKGRLS